MKISTFMHASYPHLAIICRNGIIGKGNRKGSVTIDIIQNLSYNTSFATSI